MCSAGRMVPTNLQIQIPKLKKPLGKKLAGSSVSSDVFRKTKNMYRSANWPWNGRMSLPTRAF